MAAAAAAAPAAPAASAAPAPAAAAAAAAAAPAAATAAAAAGLPAPGGTITAVRSSIGRKCYPADVIINFTRLQKPALLRYLECYGISAPLSATHQELANTVAWHFLEKVDYADEEESIYGAIEHVHGMVDDGGPRAALTNDGGLEGDGRRKRRRSQMAAYDDDEEEEEEEEEEVYCICRGPSFGQMIACDNGRCRTPAEWYHMPCVGLQPGTQPEEWFCPECEDSLGR